MIVGHVYKTARLPSSYHNHGWGQHCRIMQWRHMEGAYGDGIAPARRGKWRNNVKFGQEEVRYPSF